MNHARNAVVRSILILAGIAAASVVIALRHTRYRSNLQVLGDMMLDDVILLWFALIALPFFFIVVNIYKNDKSHIQFAIHGLY
jgi:hypothetical protein